MGETEGQVLLPAQKDTYCACGAMDSAPDFESGGCGFESRRECFLQNTFCARVQTHDELWSRAFASIAQLAEHLPRKQKVTSSILVGGCERAVGLEV